MVDESQLELVFRRIDAEYAWSAFSVETVNVVTLDAGYVDGQIKGADDAVITANGNNKNISGSLTIRKVPLQVFAFEKNKLIAF